MAHRLALAVSLLLSVTSLLWTDSRAGWVAGGVPVSTAPYRQRLPIVAASSDGGVLIAWEDESDYYVARIYVQRLDANGSASWPVGGVPVSSSFNAQYDARLAANGGGAFVAWREAAQVRIQRLDDSGNAAWPAAGVPVASCTYVVDLIADKEGGVYVVFDYYGLLRVQHLNDSGVLLWSGDGIDVGSIDGDGVADATALPDDAGGTIIMWFTPSWPRVQRVDSAGNKLWGSGRYLSNETVSGNIFELESVSDGAGGMVVAWLNNTVYYESLVFAQRVTSDGSLPWGWDPVPVATSPDVSGWMDVAPDNNGGALLAWTDSRNATVDIYAQRIGATGACAWTQNGIPITFAADESHSSIVTDGSNGAIVAWFDRRNGPWDVRAQRIDESGTLLWQEDVFVGPAELSSFAPELVADGRGGAITVWYDGPEHEEDIFAQRIEPRYGTWGRPEPVLDTVTDVPDDEGGSVRLQWTASDRDAVGQQVITHYSIWRALDAETFATVRRLVPSAVTNTPTIAAAYTGSAYREEQTTTATYYWEFIGTNPAMTFEGYTYNAATTSDATPIDPAVHHFQVVAHTADSQVYWPSRPVAGYSIDNSSPTAVGDKAPGLTWLSLRPNVPNPFSGTTTLQVGLASPSDVAIDVYDVTGRRVRTMRARGLRAGWQEVVFDGRDESARALRSGVYFYRVTASGNTATGKMVLAR